MLLMPGAGVLVVLLFISSIPAIAIGMWFRLARYPFSMLRFFIALLAGAVSFFPALLLQNLLGAESSLFHVMGKWRPVAEIFIRIAFTEEFSRLAILAIMIFALRRFSSVSVSTVAMASAAGLIAGLGFAILESAVYGASNFENALLRTFTAAPLHAACGFRVGSAAAMFHEHPAPAALRFLTAIVIHGIYNFMVLIPNILPSIAAILIALAAFATAIQAIYTGMKAENTP